MKKLFPVLSASVLSSCMLISCGGGGADEAITVGGALITSAPATVSLDPGATATYKLNGGSPLYTASSGNSNIVVASTDGGKLVLTGVALGNTSVSVVDTQGAKITIAVTVGTQGATGGPLFTNAPLSGVALDATSSATYSLGGGTAPYSAVSGNTNVAKVLVDTNKLVVTGVAAGSTSVAVTDLQGAKVSFTVTVAAQGAGLPISLTPASLTVGNCTSRIPFIFSGGVPPYRIFTSDNFSVPVSSPAPLGDGRYYFLADVHWPSPFNGLFERPATLTVLDSGSRTASASLSTPPSDEGCPSNPLLAVVPESATFRTSEILAFQITGGPVSPSVPTVTFADAGLAEVVSVGTDAVSIRALRAGSTLMTIETADLQRASVVINVL